MLDAYGEDAFAMIVDEGGKISANAKSMAQLNGLLAYTRRFHR